MSDSGIKVFVPNAATLDLLEGQLLALDHAGDPTTDLNLARSFVPGVIVLRRVRDENLGHRNDEFTHWKYTQLFDHACGLLTMTLPGWWVQYLGQKTGGQWGARIESQDDSVPVGAGCVYGPNPAVALLLAIVAAHRAMLTKHPIEEN